MPYINGLRKIVSNFIQNYVNMEMDMNDLDILKSKINCTVNS